MLGQVQGYGLYYYPCNCAMLYHSRRQKLLNNFRNILLKIAIKLHKMSHFYYHIWNQCAKHVEISARIPGIVLFTY